MKIINVKALAFPEIKVIRFARFCDQRGYFTEHFRQSDFDDHPEMTFMNGVKFVQCNESYSRAGTIRGLHFQWNPYMGKLVRTLDGRMVDMVLDIRKGSPTFKKIIAYDMPADHGLDYDEWIWIPEGFAHGNFFTSESQIEYFCSGEYSQGCEAGISPLASDIDWSACDSELKKVFDDLVAGHHLMTDKDKNGFKLAEWVNDGRSDNFIYEDLKKYGTN
jgi:dTDP-4-dehydrorhamnose 3,5-epimerase